jgi:hypothetical protein
MADPKKMKAFMDQQQDNPGNPDDEDDTGGEGAVDESDASEESQNQRKLAPDVVYMELKEDAGGFSCGTCSFLAPSESDDQAACLHPQVRAMVSPTHGCCNYWAPTDDVTVTFGQGAEPEEEETPEEEAEETPEEEAGEDEGDEDEAA